MKKTLGQIAHDGFWPHGQYKYEMEGERAQWERAGNAVKRAVLRELRREGRLAPVNSQIISVTKARKK